MVSEDVVFQVDEGVWATNGDIRLIPGVYFPLTSHIIRLSSGGLLIHSPLDFSPEAVQAIQQIGEVEKIFAPSLAHVSFLKKAHGRFPDAQLIGPSGLGEKFPDLSFVELIGEGACRSLPEEFQHVFVGGAPRFNEVVLLHKPSSALLVADYFFNIHETRGFLTKPLLRFASDALGKPTQSKLWRKAIQNREAARKSAEAILQLEFRRILVTHGEPIENGREVAEKGVSWLMEG